MRLPCGTSVGPTLYMTSCVRHRHPKAARNNSQLEKRMRHDPTHSSVCFHKRHLLASDTFSISRPAIGRRHPADRGTLADRTSEDRSLSARFDYALEISVLRCQAAQKCAELRRVSEKHSVAVVAGSLITWRIPTIPCRETSFQSVGRTSNFQQDVMAVCRRTTSASHEENTHGN